MSEAQALFTVLRQSADADCAAAIQTVSIASRVQGLAMSQSILATAPVVDNPLSASLLGGDGRKLPAQRQALRGIASEVAVYEIP